MESTGKHKKNKEKLPADHFGDKKSEIKQTLQLMSNTYQRFLLFYDDEVSEDEKDKQTKNRNK